MNQLSENRCHLYMGADTFVRVRSHFLKTINSFQLRLRAHNFVIPNAIKIIVIIIINK